MNISVYDKVWIMENNKPKEKIVFAVVKSMSFWKRGVDTHVHLVDNVIGAGWGNNEGVRYSVHNVYASRKELLESLGVHCEV